MAPGFYWVQVFCHEPAVAYWDGEEWWATGSGEPMAVANMSVLSERLPPPTASSAARTS